MAPKTKTSTGLALKQGTLPFSSAKRGSTAAGKANTGKASPSVTSVKPSSGEKREQGSRTASIGSTISINTTTTDSNSSDEVELVIPASDQRSAKRRKTETRQVKSAAGPIRNVRKVSKDDSDSSSDEEPRKLEDLNVLQKDPRIQRLYNQAKTRMGDVPPVHAKDQNKVHHILRVFDTSYEYGPCVGMTRLQRWERAHALGLNPPLEVRDILTSKQGIEDDAYKQCVFYEEL